MRERYRPSPSELRTQQVAKVAVADDQALRFVLPVREPYDFRWMCAFFASRSIAGMECVAADSYQRVVRVEGVNGPLLGWLRVAQIPFPSAESRVVLEVSASLAPVIAAVLGLAKNLFDLDADPTGFLPVLGSIAKGNPGLRVPGAVSGFEIAVRAVLGQQITVKAARTLAARFVARFGEPCQFASQPDLIHAFPAPEQVSNATASSIAELGIISRRAETILALAHAIANQQLDLSSSAAVEQALMQLNAVRGIGDWTAQYIAMRSLRWPDAFPAADYGVMKALGVKTPAQARRAADAWRPWRAYAVMHLWDSLH